MAITLADLEKAVRERKKGKKSMAPDPQEELRAIVQASLAGQAAANEPYMDRARFLTGQGPTPEKDFGFSGEIARERGLGYGDPSRFVSGPSDARGLASQIGALQGIQTGIFSDTEDPRQVLEAQAAADAEAMLNDPTLTASTNPIPTGRTTPASAPAEVLGGQLMGGGGEYQPTLLERALRQDTDWKSITDQTNAEIRREAQARGIKDYPQLTVEQIRTRDKNMKGNFLDAAMSMNPFSETTPTPTKAGKTQDPTIQRLYEQDKIKQAEIAREERWINEHHEAPKKQLKEYIGSDVQAKLLATVGPQLEKRARLVIGEYGGDPQIMIQRYNDLVEEGFSPEEAWADISQKAQRKHQQRLEARLMATGRMKYDPLAQF